MSEDKGVARASCKEMHRGRIAVLIKIWDKVFKFQLLTESLGECGWRPGHAPNSIKMNLQRRLL